MTGDVLKTSIFVGLTSIRGPRTDTDVNQYKKLKLGKRTEIWLKETQDMFNAIENYARQSGCCKLTLEVREDNAGARRLYADVGYGTEILPTIFLYKSLVVRTDSAA